MKWRPMKTAPKDGTSILLKVEGSAIEGHFHTWPHGVQEWMCVVLDFHGCGCCGGSVSEPTGWAPLPT